MGLRTIALPLRQRKWLPSKMRRGKTDEQTVAFWPFLPFDIQCLVLDYMLDIALMSILTEVDSRPWRRKLHLTHYAENERPDTETGTQYHHLSFEATTSILMMAQTSPELAERLVLMVKSRLKSSEEEPNTSYDEHNCAWQEKQGLSLKPSTTLPYDEQMTFVCLKELTFLLEKYVH